MKSILKILLAIAILLFLFNWVVDHPRSASRMRDSVEKSADSVEGKLIRAGKELTK